MINYNQFGVDLQRIGNSIIESVRTSVDNAQKEFDAVVATWATEAEARSRAKLNKPNWELSKRITSKVKTYKNGNLRYGVVGVSKKSSGRNWSDPAQYRIFYNDFVGQKDRRKRTTGFLKKNLVQKKQVQAKIDKILENIAKNIAAGVVK